VDTAKCIQSLYSIASFLNKLFGFQKQLITKLININLAFSLVLLLSFLGKFNKSAITDHAHEESFVSYWEESRVVTKESDHLSRSIREAIAIYRTVATIFRSNALNFINYCCYGLRFDRY
jgi:hypothetical protein